MSFVSISRHGSLIRLRRYEHPTRVLTHEGSYAPESVTPVDLEYYRQWGAPQDRTRPEASSVSRRHRGA